MNDAMTDLLRISTLCLWLAAVLPLPLAAQDANGPAPRSSSHGQAALGGSATGAQNALHAPFGVPVDADPADDIILVRPQFLLSYDAARAAANWVCWRLRADDMGKVGRSRGGIQPDSLLPDSLDGVEHRDYTRSGYDRGHIVPSAERTATREDNLATFNSTNIYPQHPDLNHGPWKDLEDWCRAQAADSTVTLYIIAGGVFRDPVRMIGGAVAVPDSCYKIILLLRGGQGARNVTAQTQVVAVMMPNVQGIRATNWRAWCSSVDAIERSTGYDMLPGLPDDVEAALEARRCQH